MDAYFSKDGRMQKDIKAGVRESENEGSPQLLLQKI